MDKAAQRSIGIPIKHTGLDGKLVETILGRLHPRKVSPPNTKTNPKPNTNPNHRGKSSARAIVWLPPYPKTNPALDPNSNPNRGIIFLWEQLS